jgi:hypothetical protein
MLQKQARDILNHKPNIAGQDSKSLLCVVIPPKAAAYSVSEFRAAGCDWTAIRFFGFTAADAKAAGCDVANARSAGYDVLLCVGAFGLEAVAASGCDVSFILVSCTLACMHPLHVVFECVTRTHQHTNPPFLFSVTPSLKICT